MALSVRFALLLPLSFLFWSDTYFACSPRAEAVCQCTNGTKSRAWDRRLRFNDRWRWGEETALRVAWACALSNTDYCEGTTEGSPEFNSVVIVNLLKRIQISVVNLCICDESICQGCTNYLQSNKDTVTFTVSSDWIQWNNLSAALQVV